MPRSLLDDEKLFYERFWALHGDRELLSVAHQFGIGVLRRSSVLEGFDKFLQQQKFGGERCIEIGTCKGLTAIVLARYFKEVITIDNATDPDKRAIAGFCGLRDRIRFFDIKDNSEKAEVIDGFKFDGAYVDADHIRDTEFDFALVSKCRRVLFHEYWDAQPAVKNLVDRLAKTGKVVTQGKLALWTA